jgi:hypothetical protein
VKKASERFLVPFFKKEQVSSFLERKEAKELYPMASR